MYETNSIYFEPKPDSKLDPNGYENLNLNIDEYFVGYLNKMKHYNRKNRENETRVSFDFRVRRGGWSRRKEEEEEESEVSGHSPTKKLSMLRGGYALLYSSYIIQNKKMTRGRVGVFVPMPGFWLDDRGNFLDDPEGDHIPALFRMTFH